MPCLLLIYLFVCLIHHRTSITELKRVEGKFFPPNSCVPKVRTFWIITNCSYYKEIFFLCVVLQAHTHLPSEGRGVQPLVIQIVTALKADFMLSTSSCVFCHKSNSPVRTVLWLSVFVELIHSSSPISQFVELRAHEGAIKQ